MSYLPRERERTAQALSLSSLAAWESSNGPNPRRTVQQFVQNQSTQIYSPPPKHPDRTGFNPDSSPVARNGLLDRRTEENDRNGGKEGEMAMVLGGKDTRVVQVVEVDSRRKRESVGVSRVAKMKPRTSSNAVKSTPPLAEVDKTTTKHHDRYSSPLVVPRVRNGEDTVEKENLGISNRAERRSKDGKMHESPAKQVKRTREVIVVPVRSIPKPSTSRLAKAEESEEDEEHVERLAARKSRRRAKALIVKDRTTTPAETGAAAASKVKKTRRVSKNESDEESEGGEMRGRKRKGKKGMEAVKESLKARDRAANVAEKRLTLPPPLKLGLFSKGVASARTKVTSKRQPPPELGFSELAFLNAPRRSPSPDSAAASSTSSPVSSLPPAKSKEKLAPIFGKIDSKTSKAKVTYKSQAKRKSSSKYFDVEEEDEEIDAAPLPKKSRKESDVAIKLESRKHVSRESVTAHHQRAMRGRGEDAASPSVVSRASDHSAFSNLVANKEVTPRQQEEVAGSMGGYGEGEEMIIETPSAWKGMGNVEELGRTTQQGHDTHSRPRASAQHIVPPAISPILSHSDHSLSVLSFPPDSLSPPTAAVVEVAERDDTPDTLDRLLRACETGELLDSPVDDQPSFARDEERQFPPDQHSDPVSFDDEFSHTDSAVLRDPERANIERMDSSVGGCEVQQEYVQDYAEEGPYALYGGVEEENDEPQLFGDYDLQDEEDGGFVIEEGVVGSTFQSALHQPWSEFRQIEELEEKRNYSEAMRSHWRRAKP